VKIAVILKWSDGDDKWHMVNAVNNKFIYDFFDCANFIKIFDEPDKTKKELFVIDIHRFSNDITETL